MQRPAGNADLFNKIPQHPCRIRHGIIGIRFHQQARKRHGLRATLFEGIGEVEGRGLITHSRPPALSNSFRMPLRFFSCAFWH
jgi:hypothetical protein